MRSVRLIAAVLVPFAGLLVLVVAQADEKSDVKVLSTVPVTTVPVSVLLVSNSTTNSSSTPPPKGKLPRGLNVDNMVIQRALYVLVGFTMLGVLYLLIRAVRFKRPVQKKKYGLLENCEDEVELDPLDSEEDDTLYEARALRR